MGDAACWMTLEEDVVVRTAGAHDVPELLRLRAALWPDDDIDAAGLAAFLAGPDAVVLLAEARDGKPAGFVEVGLRSYAEGCASSPVAYIEGWYVEPEWRRKGVGRLLMTHAEAWTRSRGLTELASDALLENEVSHAAHRAVGFEEVERIVTFRKEL